MNEPRLKTREAYLEQLLKEALLHLETVTNQHQRQQFVKEARKELKEPDKSLISISEAVEFITGMLDAAAFLSEIINALSPDADVKEQVDKVLSTLDDGIKQLQEQLGQKPAEEIIEDEIIR